jgi:cell division septal protein FtsQ
VVRGHYREPAAMLVGAASPTGIDSSGVAFPIPPGRTPDTALPEVDAPARDRAVAVACLGTWQKKLPDFFVVVKKLECDRMRTFHVELSDGVTVDWGTLDTAQAVDRGRKILRLMTQFSPGKAPAHLRFVTEDRIVMDNAWKTREGGNLVKN